MGGMVLLARTLQKLLYSLIFFAVPLPSLHQVSMLMALPFFHPSMFLEQYDIHVLYYVHTIIIYPFQSLSIVLKSRDVPAENADIAGKLDRLTEQLSRPVDVDSVSNF